MNHFSHKGETYEAVSDRGTDCIDHVRHRSARTGARKSLELSRLLFDASHPNRQVRDPDESVPIRLQRARAKELNASLIVYNREPQGLQPGRVPRRQAQLCDGDGAATDDGS